jgi:hypothetical protein
MLRVHRFLRPEQVVKAPSWTYYAREVFAVRETVWVPAQAVIGSCAVMGLSAWLTGTAPHISSVNVFVCEFEYFPSTAGFRTCKDLSLVRGGCFVPLGFPRGRLLPLCLNMLGAPAAHCTLFGICFLAVVQVNYLDFHLYARARVKSRHLFRMSAAEHLSRSSTARMADGARHPLEVKGSFFEPLQGTKR